MGATRVHHGIDSLRLTWLGSGHFVLLHQVVVRLGFTTERGEDLTEGEQGLFQSVDQTRIARLSLELASLASRAARSPLPPLCHRAVKDDEQYEQKNENLLFLQSEIVSSKI